ncbi:MAG: 3-phosphoshikimate 1-carboxyvinyltransferase [Thermodesulfobacteriota bacterium]
MPLPPVTVQAPSSKSLSHRALICAALAPGVSELTGILESDDTRRTMACFMACGAQFFPAGSILKVAGVGGRPQGGAHDPADLDVHESGTTCRLMTAVAAAGTGRFRIHGAPRMHERPIGSLAKALAGQDVRFEWEGRKGFPPFVMDTAGLPGGTIAIDAEESSQYLSGLLLAAPLAQAETVLELAGSKVVSWPYVSLTLQAMEDFGATFAAEVNDGHAWSFAPWRELTSVAPGRVRFRVKPGGYKPICLRVEGDWSNASYLLAAGAVGPRPVRIKGLRPDSLQGDRAILDILARMGAGVAWDHDLVTVSPAPLRGVAVDMASCPDLVPTVAVLAALAQGETVISGAAHLRIKECDRLAAPARELEKIGARAEVLDDGLRITPQPVSPAARAEFSTYGDHRMAMSLSILTLAGVRVALDDRDCVKKSFPGFWAEWAKIAEAPA